MKKSDSGVCHKQTSASLTPRQERFVQEYLLDLNSTQAAIRAGYSEKGATVRGAELLANRNVAAVIEAAKKKREKRTEITADRVLEGLAAVAFGDVRSLFDESGHLIKPMDLPDAAAKMLSGIEFSTLTPGEGPVLGTAKVKTNDRMRALELLGKHLGMFVDRKELSGPGGGPIPLEDYAALSDTERSQRLAALLDRARARRDGQAADGGPADLAADGRRDEPE